MDTPEVIPEEKFAEAFARVFERKNDQEEFQT